MDQTLGVVLRQGPERRSGVGMGDWASEAGQSHLGLAVLIFKEKPPRPKQGELRLLGVLYTTAAYLSLGASGVRAQLSLTASF